MKTAPVSGVASLMNYEASLIGEIQDGREQMWMQVVVPVTSLCPCSKRISERGAHNSARTSPSAPASRAPVAGGPDRHRRAGSLERAIGILKRPDEKHVTERAYDNPKFVEDIVRDVAVRLNAEPRVLAYVVEARTSNPSTITRPMR